MSRTKPKKKMKTSNKVLLCLGIFVFIFVVTMIVTFWVRGSVPDTLIQYTLGAGGIEALALAGIRISKTWSGEKTAEENETDEQYYS